MIRNFITSLLIATFLGTPLSFAQTTQQNKLTTNDGLPSSTIVEMVQDKTGFIWIATNDGLARYDGQKFKIFRNNPKNLNSLIDNKIISLQMTNDKVLLVTQSKNIQLFDPLTEHFTTLFTAKFLKDYKATMQKCYLSRDGKHLWGFIQGLRLVHYDFEKKKFTIFSEMDLTGRKNSLHDFYFSERGYVFVHCNFGIIQLDAITYKKKTCFYQFDKGKDAIERNFLTLLMPRNWIKFSLILFQMPSNTHLMVV